MTANTDRYDQADRYGQADSFAAQAEPEIIDYKFCDGCGKQLHESAMSCPSCGAVLQSAYAQKNKLAAALLALFFGGFGIHHFYLGNIFRGILYLALCWTFIPALLGFIEAVLYLIMSEERFQEKYPPRV